MRLTVSEIASQLGLAYEGEGSAVIEQVASLSNAAPGSVSFLSNTAYQKELKTTQASAVIMRAADYQGIEKFSVILSDNPYLSYAHIAQILNPPPEFVAEVHQSVVIGANSDIHDSVYLGPNVVLGEQVKLEQGVVIDAGSYVGNNSTIGAHTRIAANVTVLDEVTIGKRAIIHSGAVIGADGFGFANDQGRWVKIPQVGGVIIGDDVEIGACSTIDRGAIDDTRVGNGVKFDNHIQIGHNVSIGEHTAMAARAGVAGSTTVGAYCNIAGGVGIAGHITIAEGTTITGMSMVSRSLKKGVHSSGMPVQVAGEWRKNAVRLRRLNELFKRVKKLEDKA